MLSTYLPALLASVLLVAFAVWLYRRRELPVRGRAILAGLRAAALVLLVLLLWNPTLPAGPGAGPAALPAWLLLDGSRSMAVGETGATPWDRALERVGAARAAGARIETFAGTRQPIDSLRPTADESRLAEALRGAAEAGAREVRVVTDLRLEDAVQAAAELDLPGFEVTIDDVGGPARNAGMAEVVAPSAGRAGERVQIAAEVFATAEAAGDSATLTLARGETELSTWRIALPAAGATVRRTLETELPDSAGTVLWRATVRLEGDVFAADDRRARATAVDPATGIAALVALAPDWEPRFLLPVLEQVSGLPTRGWLRVGPDLFLPTGGGEPVTMDELLPALSDARLLVVQGVGIDAPAELLEVMEASRRVVVLAADAVGAEAGGVGAGLPRTGEWYAITPPPPSPLAQALAELPAAELPPLGRVMPALGELGGAAALMVQRPGEESAVPALVLFEGEGRRSVVGLAGGFWRWGFRAGAPREAYRSLWSGVVGWLLELGDGTSLAGVAPDQVVVPAAEPVSWRAPEAANGRIELAMDTAGEVVRVDTLEVDPNGRARQPPLSPAAYGWRARILDPDSVASRERTWSGVLEAEAWTDELRPPRAELEPSGATAAGRGGARARAGIPLRTRPWPYLLLLGLLCAEWIGRRRSGLR